MKHFPSIREIERAINFKVSKWKGQCDGVVRACLNSGVLKGTYARGHYIGPVAATGHFAGRPVVQHSWIELPDGRICDPTRWVFEDAEPYLYIGENNGEYDFGGNHLRALFRSPRPARDPHDATTRLDLKGAARVRVAAMLDRPAWDGVLTYAEAGWIANTPLHELGDLAKPIYRAIVKAGHAALIPMDNRRRVLGE